MELTRGVGVPVLLDNEMPTDNPGIATTVVNTRFADACALDVAVRHPTVFDPATTLGDVREYLANDHAHLALVIDSTKMLLTSVTRWDLKAVRQVPDQAPALAAGTFRGRTVDPTMPVPLLLDLLDATASRRMAVVNDGGQLLGLVCLQRTRLGFCNDDGIRQRRSDSARHG